MRLILIMLVLSASYALNAQQHDNTWVFGTLNDYFTINFNSEGPIMTVVDMPMELERASSTISNRDGELQYYTNGCSLLNYNHEVIEGGDVVNTGDEFNRWCGGDQWNEIGYYPGRFQSMVSTPVPHKVDQYYLLHKPHEWNDMPRLADKGEYVRSYLTTIDMAANNGEGEVVSKELYNIGLVEGPLSLNKHANGDDWWVIDPLLDSDIISVWLLDSSGIHFSHEQQIGLIDSDSTRGFGHNAFSPDGQLFMKHAGNAGTQLFDFDRTTGRLSNYRHVSFPEDDPLNDAYLGYGGVAVSPNGEMLYTSNAHRVYQYDLTAPDLEASRVLIGDIVSRQDTQRNPTSTIHMQLGPDCQLYVLPFKGNELHVIHNPNGRGAAADWEAGAYRYPDEMFRDSPYFPNYRLGPLGNEGSPCVDYDAVSTTEESLPAEPLVTLYPNPTTGPVSLQLRQALGQESQWTLRDARGRVVLTKVLPRGATLLDVSTSQLPAGMYLWELSGTNRQLESGKLIVH